LDAIIKNIAPTVEYTRLHTQFLRTLLCIWQGLTFVSIASGVNLRRRYT
jgi:hypothetical protein